MSDALGIWVPAEVCELLCGGWKSLPLENDLSERNQGAVTASNKGFFSSLNKTVELDGLGLHWLCQEDIKQIGFC